MRSQTGSYALSNENRFYNFINLWFGFRLGVMLIILYIEKDFLVLACVFDDFLNVTACSLWDASLYNDMPAFI